MSSKIEQQIDQIEDFIDSCKYQTFSKTNIIVDKDELDGLLEELVPEHPMRSATTSGSSITRTRSSRMPAAKRKR